LSRSSKSFLSSLPAGAASSDITVSASGATVANTSAVEAGHNYREGYIDLTYTNSDLAGKLLTLDTTRVNSIANGDFSTAITASDSDSYGGWQYPSSSTGSISQSASSVGSGNALWMTEGTSSGNFYFQQAFDIEPGELYRVSYKSNPGSLSPAFVRDGSYSDGRLEVRIKTTTSAGGSALSVNLPGSGSSSPPTSTALATTSQNYEKLVTLTSSSDSSQSHRFVTLDCDVHTIYTFGGTAGPGQNHTSDLTFQRYSAGSSTCNSLVKYGQLVFVFASTASNGSRMELDDVQVDWERQLETEIRDTAGNVLQRSTLESFRVDALDPGTYPSLVVRIYLRSLNASNSPTLKGLHVETGNALAITVNPTPTVEFTSPRLGIDLHIPPKSEFNSSSVMPSLQSTCFEPGSTTRSSECFDILSKYNLTRGRVDLPASSFSFSASGTDYAAGLTSAGTSYLSRIKEANDAGLDPLILLPVHSSMENICSSSGLAVSSRPTSGVWSSASDSDIAKHLFELYAKQAVTYLDGSTGVGARATRFELFNEPNLAEFESACPSLIPTSDIPSMANTLASTLAATRSGIAISTPGLAPDSNVFDTDYLGGTLLPALTAANFQNTNFHPYTDSYRPEKISERWNETKATLSAAGWDPLTQTAHLGEFGYSGVPFDPACPNSSGTYSFFRGWGAQAQANRYAIGAIEGLATESESVVAWGRMNNESESSDPDCWKSGGGYKTLFDRVEGTGYLSTGSHSDITQYAPNPAGESFLMIGKHLSNSSPTTSPSVTTPSLAGSANHARDHYHAKFFKTDFGYAAAVWFYQDYEFGLVEWDLEEQSDIYYQNYLYGARSHGTTATSYGDPVQDHGFEGKRIHDITLTSSSGTFPGLPFSGTTRGTATQGAVIVDLETLSETLVTATFSPGSIQLTDITIGERPILILIRSLGSTSYPWENLSPWYDPDPTRYNDWFIVNRDKTTTPPSTSGTYTFVQGHKSTQLYGGVHRTGNSNPYFGYRGSTSRSKIPVYNSCPGNPSADYGICIKN